jgi:hypothetical protein
MISNVILSTLNNFERSFFEYSIKECNDESFKKMLINYAKYDQLVNKNSYNVCKRNNWI